MSVARFASIALVVQVAPLLAQTSGDSAARPAILPRSEETALALSAAPPHLRDSAGVYVLDAAGYVQTRVTTNGFTCIVNRDEVEALKPTCYDAEGTATILPKVLRVGELLMGGWTRDRIQADINEGFRSGRFISPRRPGVAYMLSGHIRNYDPRTGSTSSFPPHVMFYAPNLTNRDIGTTAAALRAHPSTPFVAYEGPHAFLIVVCPQPAVPAK